MSKEIIRLATKGIAMCFLVASLTACSFSTVLDRIMTTAGVIKGVVVMASWFPPASDLAAFDASLASQYVDFQNMSLTATTGTVEISISDEYTGAVLGSRSFGYIINNGHQVTFDNPAVVTGWVRSFSGYNGFVTVAVSTQYHTTAPPGNTQGTASSTMSYAGVPYASASSTISNGRGGCSGPAICVAE